MADGFDIDWTEGMIAKTKALPHYSETRPEWTNSRMALAIRAIRERDRVIKETQSALLSLLPGYQQYLDWAKERGTMFLSEGRKTLDAAVAATKLVPGAPATTPDKPPE